MFIKIWRTILHVIDDKMNDGRIDNDFAVSYGRVEEKVENVIQQNMIEADKVSYQSFEKEITASWRTFY